jgi:hypothetical protein
MKPTKPDFHLVFQDPGRGSASSYRLLDPDGNEVPWVNEFLDLQHMRGLSPRSLRAYGYDLLHFARWWMREAIRPLCELDDSVLLDYIRYQLDQEPKPTPQTVNHRLVVLQNLHRYHYHHGIPSKKRCLERAYSPRNPLGYGRRGVAVQVSVSKNPDAWSCLFLPNRSLGSGAAFAPFVISAL